MTSQTKSRLQSLVLAGFVALAVLLLLLRLFVFAHGHGRRRVGQTGQGSAMAMAAIRTASYGTNYGSGTDWKTRPWTDRFGDGTPDFLRLTDPADQAAFRQWFTLIADYQAIRPRAEISAEITDCASLLRYSYREALKRHDDTWFVATGIEVAALPGEIRAWRYPETPLEGNLLVCRNLDVPGVIGKIGTILGEHGVNIANFTLGRERSGKKPVQAFAVVQVDAPVGAPVLAALATIEALLEAKPVSVPEAKFCTGLFAENEISTPCNKKNHRQPAVVFRLWARNLRIESEQD
jgi:hypothetical protein